MTKNEFEKLKDDECNRDWKADWNDCNSKKWIITKNEEEIYAMGTNGLNIFFVIWSFQKSRRL